MRLKFPTIVFFLIVISLPLSAKKPNFPLQILNARSVAIMYLSSSGPAGDVNTPSLTTQDRDVLNAVTVAFRNWSRYSVTIDPRQADIIIAVRTAQQNVNAGGGIGIDNHGGISKQATYGADIGPAVDMIQIYAANTDSPDRGLTGAVLWTGAEKHGLTLPDLPLMKRLHQEVDEAEKNRK